MSRRHTHYEKQAQAFHEGEIVGEALAVANPEIKQAGHLPGTQIANERKLTGTEREEFLKGMGWGWTGKKYALPDSSRVL